MAAVEATEPTDTMERRISMQVSGTSRIYADRSEMQQKKFVK